MSEKYDVIAVGMGPSSIFMAYELIKLKKAHKVLLIEQGKKVEDRYCPIEKTGNCIKCKPFCNITSGFSGAGAFSDGKLSLYNKEDDDIYIGGILHEYIGVEETKRLIDYTDKIYLDFGADTKLEGTEHQEEIKKISDKAKKEGINLINIPIRHLGTEKAHELYKRLEDYLSEHHIEMKYQTIVEDLIIEKGKIKGVRIKPAKELNNEDAELEEIYADNVVIAVGRKGANWLVNMCEKHNIKTKSGIVDIGVRYELPDRIMKDINTYMYEGKFIGKPEPFKDKVRTFCQNPSGFVASEVYDNNLSLVNGHSYKDLKSNNTNLAILCSHNFTEPFNQPIEYAKKVGELTNMLGAGQIMVQRYGDILDGKRTWQKELAQSNVKPTLPDAVAGDITAAMPYRAMVNIINFIQAVDHVVPGFASTETLLYSPELKFYSNKVKMDENLNTNVEHLYCLGDSSGWTRGLMMASVMGVFMGRKLI